MEKGATWAYNELQKSGDVLPLPLAAVVFVKVIGVHSKSR